ncbi:MAG: Ig-like domain-containing protein [Flavobacteriaceae bacterium]
MGYNFSLLKQVFFYLTLCVASYAAAHNLCGPNDQPSLSLSANYLFINDTALMPGDSQDIPLLIYLEESSRGLQFDVTIPSEFSFVLADLETDPILANFSVTSSDLGNGTYRIIVFTFGSSTLPIGAYPIFYMPVTVDNAALPGFYAFPLTNVTISGTNNQNIATTALVQGFIEILGNNAPVASGQSVSTDEDTMIQITLEATDVDGDPLTYTIVTQPANGTAVLTGNTVEYTPDANYNGPDSFTFTANDGTIDSNVATVSIDVLLNVPEYDWYARIAPIPFNETISIDLPEAATIMVYDMAGQKIRSFHGLSLGRQWLSLPELPSGVYFMIVKMDKSNQAIRIIKQ